MGTVYRTSKSAPQDIIKQAYESLILFSNLNPSRSQVHFFKTLIHRPIIHPSFVPVGAFKPTVLTIKVCALLYILQQALIILTQDMLPAAEEASG